jgi:hypothetical protein
MIFDLNNTIVLKFFTRRQLLMLTEPGVIIDILNSTIEPSTLLKLVTVFPICIFGIDL